MKLFRSLIQYFQGVYSEMKKVVWPDFKTLMRYFFSVVIGVLLAGTFIFAIDWVAHQAIGLIVK